MNNFQPDIHDLAHKFQDSSYYNWLHSEIAAPPWHMDSHESAEWLAASTKRALQIIVKPRGSWKRKSHISTATWDLIETKKALFKQIKALRRSVGYTVLRACFQGWR